MGNFRNTHRNLILLGETPSNCRSNVRVPERHGSVVSSRMLSESHSSAMHFRNPLFLGGTSLSSQVARDRVIELPNSQWIPTAVRQTFSLGHRNPEKPPPHNLQRRRPTCRSVPAAYASQSKERRPFNIPYMTLQSDASTAGLPCRSVSGSAKQFLSSPR